MNNKSGFGDRVKVFSDDSNACGSITRLMEGKSAEMHFHLKSDKVVYILSGIIKMIIIKNGISRYQKLAPGSSVSIKAGVVHQFEALTDSIIIEFGTNPQAYDLDSEDVHVIDNGSVPVATDTEIDE